MESHSLSSMKYSYLWNKYKPVILRLMIDAENGPQQYQFLKHEFQDINQKEKGGHTFDVEISYGRPGKKVNDSPVAKSLYVILDRSLKATELIENATYRFVLDKQYTLHINQLSGNDTQEEIGNEKLLED